MKHIDGRMSKDGNGHLIQTANAFSTVDASATPKQSPQALTTTEIEIKAPKGAVAIILYADDVVYLDSVTGVGPAKSMKLIADTYLQLSIAEGDSIFIEAATTANLSFIFLKLQQ